MNQEPIRLNKCLDYKLGLRRREADDLIASGRVLIDGQPAKLGNRLTANQRLTVDGKLIDQGDQRYTYLMLNKPAGYVCSRRAQDETPTIYDLLPDQYSSLKSAGRLDKDSSGLIILSDDGDFIFKMTHPSFNKTKTYEINLDQPLTAANRQKIEQGIKLDDGLSKLGLEAIDDTNWRVIMHEGRNRQIRRTFAALGLRVVKLHRTHFGPYELGDLAPGKYILVSST